jgi:lysophospholipase L1-like esterase
MSALTLARGTSSFTAGAAKFGADGLASGVYYPALGQDAIFNATANLTVEGWIQTTSSGSLKIWTGNHELNWAIGLAATGVAMCTTYSGQTLTSAVTINDGAWHHMALVLTNGAPVLWVDGVSAVSAAAGPIVSGNTSSQMGVGGYGDLTTLDWIGAIDEVRISNTARYSAPFTPPVAAFTTDANTVALWHLDGNGADSSSFATTYAPNDARIVYSPYNWDVQAARALSVNSGAYFKTLITGSPTSVTLTFDLTSAIVAAAPYPQVAYRFDGQAWTRLSFAASMALTLPTATSGFAKRELEVALAATSQNENRWNSPPVAGIAFTGLTVSASGGTIVAPALKPFNIMCIGDSITEGVYTLGGLVDVNSSDATLGWAYLLSANLAAEVGVVGFGSQGFQVNGNGNVPFVHLSYNLIAAGISRSFSPAPNVIVINEGTNDGTVNVQTQMGTLLNGLLAVVPTTTKIVVLRPFNGTSQAANWQAAIAACNAPSQVAYIDTTGFVQPADTEGGLHPTGAINMAQISPLVAQAVRPYLLAQKRFVNVGGVAKPVGTVLKS